MSEAFEPTSVFYSKFERHDHAEGLKGHATHYCPGCGHGLVHKYLAEAIDDLGVQDRTVAISPVGCAVFLYYYLDVGNTQAAHGRAPAVGLGHKMANPGSVVVCYQGDGDLAAIGLAEVLQVAQMGVPMTFVFVNNAIYGMTGGQMAPTTLREQRTTTSPDGRTREMGEPLRMAELVAGLDGPAYVERVALFNPKQRNRARKAIHKALRLQVEGRGLGFVEVLSECPIHLGLTGPEAEHWVEDHMVPVFPLGVKKDLDLEPWFEPQAPSFDPQRLVAALGAGDERSPRFAQGFPTHLDARDVGVKLAGAGGDGAQTAASLLNRMSIAEGFDSTYIPSYGPESRGGTSYADLHVALGEVLSPAVPDPQVLVVFNPPSLEKFGPAVRPGGVVIYDSSVIDRVPELDPSVTAVGVPFTEIAMDLGWRVVKNVVALGALQAVTRIFPPETFLAALERHLGRGRDPEAMRVNREAFERGRAACVTVPPGGDVAHDRAGSQAVHPVQG